VYGADKVRYCVKAIPRDGDNADDGEDAWVDQPGGAGAGPGYGCVRHMVARPVSYSLQVRRVRVYGTHQEGKWACMLLFIPSQLRAPVHGESFRMGR